MIVNQPVEALKIIEFAEFETVQHRSKAMLNLFLRRCGHTAKRSTVKCVLGADHLITHAFLAVGKMGTVQPRKLEQAFVGFGPAVAEKHLARPRALDEFLREPALRK